MLFRSKDPYRDLKLFHLRFGDKCDAHVFAYYRHWYRPAWRTQDESATSCEQEHIRLLQFRICRRWKRLLRPPPSLPRQRVARACEKNRHTPADGHGPGRDSVAFVACHDTCSLHRTLHLPEDERSHHDTMATTTSRKVSSVNLGLRSSLSKELPQAW